MMINVKKDGQHAFTYAQSPISLIDLGLIAHAGGRLCFRRPVPVTPKRKPCALLVPAKDMQTLGWERFEGLGYTDMVKLTGPEFSSISVDPDSGVVTESATILVE